MDQLLFNVVVLGLALMCFAWVGRSVRKEQAPHAHQPNSEPHRAGRHV